MFAVTLLCSGTDANGRMRHWTRYVKVTARSRRRAVLLARKAVSKTADEVHVDRVLELPSELPTAPLYCPPGVLDS